MTIFKRVVLYFSLILLFGGGIYFLLKKGNSLPQKERIASSSGSMKSAAATSFIQGAAAHLQESLPKLLLQIILIIATTQILGTLFRKIGQPAVIGEIVAGIILGPSLFGLFFPQAFHFLFPVSSMENLRFLSQLGLILFMFIIGMDLDIRLIRRQAFAALIISHASIVIPYALGIALAFFLYETYAPAGTSFTHFALFMGIAMSITAFPVLARIIHDRKLSGTKLGTLAITCAASDDVTAWCLLALLVAMINSGSMLQGAYTIAWVALYAMFMLLPVSWMLKKIYSLYTKNRIGYPFFMAIVFSVLLFSAWCTEIIGIHALFGAFVAGIIVPRDAILLERIQNRIHDITLLMLLPLFFVFTGLRTQAALLHTPALWLVLISIITVAVVGKFGGTLVAARLVGQTWRDSLSLGALMNTRGLVELIVLNIGYDMGILSAEIFTMLVLMALITTMMTSPLLTLISGRST